MRLYLTGAMQAPDSSCVGMHCNKQIQAQNAEAEALGFKTLWGTVHSLFCTKLSRLKANDISKCDWVRAAHKPSKPRRSLSTAMTSPWARQTLVRYYCCSRSQSDSSCRGVQCNWSLCQGTSSTASCRNMQARHHTREHSAHTLIMDDIQKAEASNATSNPCTCLIVLLEFTLPVAD